MSVDCLAEYYELDKSNNKSTNPKESVKRSLEAMYLKKDSDRNSTAKKNSLTSYLNLKFKALDSVYLTSTNSLIPRDEILNSISYSKSLNIQYF